MSKLFKDSPMAFLYGIDGFSDLLLVDGKQCNSASDAFDTMYVYGDEYYEGKILTEKDIVLKHFKWQFVSDCEGGSKGAYVESTKEKHGSFPAWTLSIDELKEERKNNELSS